MNLKEEHVYLFLILLVVFAVYAVSLGVHFFGGPAPDRENPSSIADYLVIVSEEPSPIDNYYSLTISIVETGSIERTRDLEKIYSDFCRPGFQVLSRGVNYFLFKKVVWEGWFTECESLLPLSQGVVKKAYSTYPPGSSFAAVPFYFVASAAGLSKNMYVFYLINSLFSIGILFFIYQTARLYTNIENAQIITAIAAFGTIIYTYSQTFAADVLAALLVTSAFYYFLLFLRSRKPRYAVLPGAILGYIFITKPPLVFIPAVLFLAYAHVSHKAKDYRPVVLYSLAFLAVFFASSYYNYHAFGSFFTTGYSSILNMSEYVNSGTLQTTSALSQFTSNPAIQGPFILLGIVLASPFLAFSFLKMDLSRTEDQVIFALLGMTLVIFGFFYSPFGARAFGPRHELYMIPLLLIPLMRNMGALRKQKLFWILVALGFVITIIGTLNFFIWDYWSQADAFISNLARFKS
jgi:4-amino-4-deoxy-L-arabinose transferase-like glycosyltransferase